jgi:hypothetical protein
MVRHRAPPEDRDERLVCVEFALAARFARRGFAQG